MIDEGEGRGRCGKRKEIGLRGRGDEKESELTMGGRGVDNVEVFR
jgi:hypothetical protein